LPSSSFFSAPSWLLGAHEAAVLPDISNNTLRDEQRKRIEGWVGKQGEIGAEKWPMEK
jgi:hypothetical protein